LAVFGDGNGDVTFEFGVSGDQTLFCCDGVNGLTVLAIFSVLALLHVADEAQ
jgi:hypothetical protein